MHSRQRYAVDYKAWHELAWRWGLRYISRALEGRQDHNHKYNSKFDAGVVFSRQTIST